MGINLCRECLKKQQRIDDLREENQRLKQKLKYQERKEKEGFFGSATSSAKVPIKANTAKSKAEKRKGAQRGHKGAGRKAFPEGEADQVVTVGDSLGPKCPDCGRLLEDKGAEERLVIESQPLKAQRVIYRLPKKYCPHCQKVFQAQAPAVLPKSLYGNQLITTAAVMHYLHGIPMGRVCEQTEMGPGSLVEIFHRLARLFDTIPVKLIESYRQAPVKHADETSWRTEGRNGYAWLFATETLSLFQFRKSRSASVPQAVFGEKPLPGVLVVDRYAGYNKVPCALQYCYAHLLREVEDLEQEFPDSEEVQRFASTFIPLLTLAMGLRNQRLSPTQFHRKATQVQSQIRAAVESPAKHLGIRRLQDIFRENESRLYHWAKDRNVPAENNLAERDLRPTVIARKVSFGSQSDAGAHTRGVLMTVLNSLKKRGADVATHLKHVLDELAKNITQDPFPLLFPRDPPQP
jgi:transposase